MRRSELLTNAVRNGIRDLVLDGEDVREIPVKPGAPQLIAGLRIHQLRRDPDTLVDPPDGTLDDVVDAQPRRDVVQFAGSAPESETRGTRRHLEPTVLGEAVQDVLADAIGEVLVSRISARVHERQDGNRRKRCLVVTLPSL